MGSLIAFSSYNKNNTTLLRDSLLIGLANSSTSFISGFIVFGILGNISHSMGLEVRELAASGPELIFVSLPQVWDF